MADFAYVYDVIRALGAEVYALTTDSEEHVREVSERHGLKFPVLYGMDGPKTAELLDAWYEERRNIIQPADFLLLPDRTIGAMSFASGPLGRFTAAEVLSQIQFLKQKAAGA